MNNDQVTPIRPAIINAPRIHQRPSPLPRYSAPEILSRAAAIAVMAERMCADAEDYSKSAISHAANVARQIYDAVTVELTGENQ